MSILKFLVLSLCMAFMPLEAWCAIATNTQALLKFDGDFTDATGTYNFTNTGSVPFSASTGVCGASSTQAAGPFANGKRGEDTALYAANSGISQWTVEGYVYLTSSSVQFPLYIGQSSAVGPFDYVAVVVGTGGTLKLAIDDADQVVSSALTLNSCYYFAVVATSSSAVDFYVSAADSISQTPIGTASGAGKGTWPTAAGGICVGCIRFATSTFPYTGYFDELRFSNVARTSFPTTDLSTAPAVLSPYIRQWHFPFVSPMWDR